MERHIPAATVPLFDRDLAFVARIDEHRARKLIAAGHATMSRSGLRRRVELKVSREEAGLVRVIHREENPGRERTSVGSQQKTTHREHLPGVMRGFSYIHQHQEHLRDRRFRPLYLTVLSSVIVEAKA